MNRPALLGATLALLMTSGAFAQDPPAPGTGELLPPPAELAPAAPGPGANPGTAPEAEADSAPTAAEALDQVDRMRERGDRRRGMREDRRERDGRRSRDRYAGAMGGDEQFEWRDHHPRGMMDGMGMRPRMGSQGAVFRFSRGNGGPSIVIRCADRDTTQECVDAVGPMLQMMLPNAQ